MRHSDRVEELTLCAFQTVRVWVLTKNKKKMPDFASLLPTTRADAKQDAGQLKSALHMLAAQYGGTVRKATKK